MQKKLRINKKKLKKLEPTKDAFASLVRSIIYQQLSGKAAASIERKFFGLFHTEALKATSERGKLLKVKYPKPEQVLKLTNAQFRSAGVSGQKMGYLRDLATKFIDGTVNQKNFKKMTDEEIIEHLTKVKGVGVWTAHMFLIFALNRPDVLPTGDLAIRKGFMRAFSLKKVPSHDKMVKLATPHTGERTHLSLHLWALMDEANGSSW
jgi:DNA-3-methyladenine glycosylase II